MEILERRLATQFTMYICIYKHNVHICTKTIESTFANFSLFVPEKLPPVPVANWAFLRSIGTLSASGRPPFFLGFWSWREYPFSDDVSTMKAVCVCCGVL